MAFDRPCDVCGTVYAAARRTSKFCSTACRVRAHRRPAAADEKASSSPTQPAETASDAEGSLAAQVTKALANLDALDTVAGAQAVRVARQIDKGQDTGSAVATLSKELSRLIAEAKAEAAPRQKDPADDIAARVGEKLLKLVS